MNVVQSNSVFWLDMLQRWGQEWIPISPSPMALKKKCKILPRSAFDLFHTNLRIHGFATIFNELLIKYFILNLAQGHCQTCLMRFEICIVHLIKLEV
jgi:hypothetical protein